MTRAVLVIPARCRSGHVLEPRTVSVRTDRDPALRAVGWDCVVCVRVDCWQAYTSEPIPERFLEPAMFIRGSSQNLEWWQGVFFEGGQQYSDPDPVCEPPPRRRRRSPAPAS